MAAPTYATDLADIALAENGETWGEPTGSADGAAPSYETDYFIQQANCFSKACAIQGGGLCGMGTLAGSAKTITSPAAVFVWLYFACPNTLDTETNGGMQVIMGNTLANYRRWYVKGKDTYTYGGWVNIAVDPNTTYQATYGSPSGTWQYFGAVMKTLATVSKGSPFGTDAIRFGRELRITNGDLANGYATFAGVATKNDANDATAGYNRWGLFQAIDGGYLQKGLFLMGLAATSVDFRDSNRNITIQNSLRVASTFNGFEVRNTSSRVDWTNISISSLCSVSRGFFVATDNATINKSGCTFTDMDTFIYQSNSIILNTTFRRCNLVTQASATFTGCTFDSTNDATKAILVNNPTAVTSCKFISSGTKHAIELTTACAGNSYNLTGHTFTGYATSNGSTGNEVIYNNSGGAVTLNVSNCTGTISVKNGTNASTIIVSGTVSATVTVKTVDGTNIQNAMVLVRASNNTGPFPYDVTVTISNSGTTATVTHTAHGMATNDKIQISGASLLANNGVFSITYISDNSYSYTMSSSLGSSPTGTIKATYVALNGLTDSNGAITMSRVFSSNQPVVGWARKSSSAPYYKQGPINGTINSTTGFSTTAILIAD